MTVIVFILDTSASMVCRNYRGCSALDMARGFLVEFVKMRGRDFSAKQFDRYYIVTTEEYPGCVKELKNIWREGSLNEQLKQLRMRGRCHFSDAMLNAFKFINLIRSTTGIDNYGYGRYPYYIDPVMFVSLCDGFAIDEIPSSSKLEFRGKHELTKEAYRWDHRLFSVVFRMSAEFPSFTAVTRPDADIDVIQKMCASTGGSSFAITNHRQLGACIDSLVSSMQYMGVNVRFQCPTINGVRQNGETETPEIRLKKRLEVRPLTKVIVRMVGGKPVTNHWPIPEAFWHKRMDGNSLPPRSSHPILVFGLDPASTQMLTDFPFDKYELEPSPVVDFLLEKFKDLKTDQCLHVFVHGSGKTDGYGKPFGFLKLTSAGTGVNLFLMPYNYPVLLQLLQELKADQSVRTNPEWRRRLDNYLESVPPYYLNGLRKNMLKFKVSGGLLDDQQNSGNTYSPPIMKVLNAIRPQAKEEYDRINSSIMTSLLTNNGPLAQMANLTIRAHIVPTKHWRSELDQEQPAILPSKKDRGKERKGDPRSGQTDEEVFKDPEESIDCPAGEKTNVQIFFSEGRKNQSNLSTFRNPLVIKRSEIADNVPKMLVNITMLVRGSNIPLLQGGRAGSNLNLHQAEELHSLPISQMGNYEEYIKAQHEAGWTPLRDVEPKAVRAHAFGNPFKTDKKMSIDEVGESPVDTAASRETRRDRRSGHVGRPPKRKPGPLAQNALSNWRERRRTISERSSVVSDLSYTSDLDTGKDEVRPSTSHLNGNGHVTNGLCGSTLSTNGTDENQAKAPIESWRMKDEIEREAMGPEKKKAKLEETKTTDMGYDQMRQKKLIMAEIVRKPNNELTVLDDILSVATGLSVRDNLELVEFSLRDSRRFKRKSLTTELDKELTRLRKLAKLTNCI